MPPIDVTRYLPLALFIARSVWNEVRRTVELDELRGEAFLGLLLAAQKFQAEKNRNVDGWMSFKVKMHLYDYLRSHHPHMTRRELKRVQRGEMEARVRHDLKVCDAQRLSMAGEHQRIDDRDEVETYLRRLDWKARDYLRRHFLQGTSQFKLGRTYGVCPSRVSQMHREALAKVKEVSL